MLILGFINGLSGGIATPGIVCFSFLSKYADKSTLLMRLTSLQVMILTGDKYLYKALTINF